MGSVGGWLGSYLYWVFGFWSGGLGLFLLEFGGFICLGCWFVGILLKFVVFSVLVFILGILGVFMLFGCGVGILGVGFFSDDSFYLV